MKSIYISLTAIFLLVIIFGCTKEKENTQFEGRILSAYPGVHGEVVEFVINGDTITCERINGEYVFQGDIILDEEQLMFSDTTKGSGLPLGIFRWPEGKVYYKIDSGASNYSDEINAAMDEIEKCTSIEFIERTNQPFYVRFIYGDGFSSKLGMRFLPEIGQPLTLGPWTFSGDVIHELCHALGMIHEFARSDRDGSVIIHWDNIVDEKKHNFVMRKCKFNTYPFDFNSITMYPSITTDKDFAIDIEKPIITKRDGTPDGSTYEWNYSHLSQGDIEVINLMYSQDWSVQPPFVATDFPIDVKAEQIEIGGRVIFNGNAFVTETGVYWGKNSEPVANDVKVSISKGDGSFSTVIKGLNPLTVYRYKAYAINSAGISYGESYYTRTNDGMIFNPNLIYGSVSDVDGNSYKTIQIGTQIWMAENLKTTKYNDGSSIPLVTTGVDWASLSTDAYCWYNNDVTSNKPIYGALYNWYAISSTTNGGRNLCPTGWHIPSDSEWKVLEMFLGMTQEQVDATNPRGTIEGGKLKETNTAHWLSPNMGATNESGFTALPGGVRHSTSTFALLTTEGCWWTITEGPSTHGWTRVLDYNLSSISRGNYNKKGGLSIRCVKD